MNLVTAIIVDCAVQQSNDDREARKAYESQRRRALLPKLKKMFEELDADGSGQLEMDEIDNAPPHILSQLEQLTNKEGVMELFQLLDFDNSGGVDINEFCE